MEVLGVHPGRKIISYFLIAIIIGTVLLSLPVSSAGNAISPIDALFTATSAVCVTGLTVVDTGTDFSLFGQMIILVLIQLGGLGIMTFATILLQAAGARLPMMDRIGLSQSFASDLSISSYHLLLAVLVTTFVIELIGTVALFSVFVGDFSAGKALYLAIFHSVSAFCNAGFSLWSSSLENYFNRPAVIMIFSFLIILGGLGFVVIRDIMVKLRNRRHRFSLHSKLCLSTTAILLVGGTIFFYLAEVDNIFANWGPVTSATNAFFQAVTCRTAGFNSMPLRHMTEISLLLSLILMFIGACPGSTGGGIKTTTIAVIIILAFDRMRGRRQPAAFRRSISADSISRALTIFIIAVFIITLMFVLLLMTSKQIVTHEASHGWFVDNLFETVSAFGTVGLSLGMTPHLPDTGKLVIILSMFIGRVGILTFIFAMIRPERKGELIYADEPVAVG